MKTGFTCGSFDLMHTGHCLMLKEAKSYCDYLIVGLHTDPTIDRKHKNKPIQSLEERYIQLKSNKYIDAVMVYDTEEELYNFLKNVKIDIRIIGADWKDKKYTGYDLKIPMAFNTREHNYSSTELRNRIKVGLTFLVPNILGII